MNTEIMVKTIRHYGPNAQVNLCIEEMSELTKELLKNKRGFNNKAEIIEELADVTYMLEQIKTIFGISEENIQELIELKQIRTMNRMEKEND